MSFTNGNGIRRTWEETVIARGLAILSKLVMPIVYDFGDNKGRPTKFNIDEVIQLRDGRFRFPLLVQDQVRGLLIGHKCLHLSALQIIFNTAVKVTFPRDERPEVVVAIHDPRKNRMIMPQELVPESELEPLDEEDDELDDEQELDDEEEYGDEEEYEEYEEYDEYEEEEELDEHDEEEYED